MWAVRQVVGNPNCHGHDGTDVDGCPEGSPEQGEAKAALAVVGVVDGSGEHSSDGGEEQEGDGWDDELNDEEEG